MLVGLLDKVKKQELPFSLGQIFPLLAVLFHRKLVALLLVDKYADRLARFHVTADKGANHGRCVFKRNIVGSGSVSGKLKRVLHVHHGVGAVHACAGELPEECKTAFLQSAFCNVVFFTYSLESRSSPLLDALERDGHALVQGLDACSCTNQLLADVKTLFEHLARHARNALGHVHGAGQFCYFAFSTIKCTAHSLDLLFGACNTCIKSVGVQHKAGRQPEKLSCSSHV